MNMDLIAIALGDVTWISIAFLLGFAATLLRLPPLVGFLLAGFLLNIVGAQSGDVLQKLADLGIGGACHVPREPHGQHTWLSDRARFAVRLECIRFEMEEFADGLVNVC